jgi:hypothetical protein
MNFQRIKDFLEFIFCGRQWNIPLEYSFRVDGKGGDPPVSGCWRKRDAGPAVSGLEGVKERGAGLSAARLGFSSSSSRYCSARAMVVPRRRGSARRPATLRRGTAGDGGAWRRGAAALEAAAQRAKTRERERRER